MNIELNIWREAWNISMSNPPQTWVIQEDRCIACGEIVSGDTQLCDRCREIIEPR